MKENLLVTLADKNFIQQAKQLFSGVYWNAGWKGDYMLLAHEIPEKELKWFRDKGILIKKCKSLYKRSSGNYFLSHWKEYPSTLFDIFYLFTPEFKKWKNIVALEADIIIRASLDKLIKLKGFWATDLLDNAKLSAQFADNKIPEIIKKEYNLDEPSFNPGVIAFSTDIINDNSFRDIKRLSDTYREISNGDEGIFNLFFYKKWKKLPFSYNVWPGRINLRFNIKRENVRGIVLHFVGGTGKDNLKPWDKEDFFYKEWKSNLDKAELIDLNNIPKGKKINSFRIFLYSSYMHIKPYLSINFSLNGFYHFYFKIKKIIIQALFLIKKLFHFLKYLPDRFIGKFGIFLKKHNPNLYTKLKNIEKKIRK